MKNAALRVVSAEGRPASREAHEKAMRWKPVRFEVAEGEFAVVLTAGGPSKDGTIDILSFAARYDDIDIYFQGRLTGRGGQQEAEAMQSLVKVLNAESALEAVASDLDYQIPILIIDLTGTSTAAISAVSLLRFVKRLCLAGSAVILFTPDPFLAIVADSVYRLGEAGLQRIDQ